MSGEHVAEIIPFQSTTPLADSAQSHSCSEASLTEAVYVVFSSVEDTLIAAGVGHRLAVALHVSLIVVHFQTVPYPMPLDRPAEQSPAETETFVSALREAGIDADVRVLLCREPSRTLAGAFKGQSLVVLAGQRSLWPRRSASARMRRVLEAAGTSWSSLIHRCRRPPPRRAAGHRRRASVLDLFYLAIGVIGFVALWGITKACDRA